MADKAFPGGSAKETVEELDASGVLGKGSSRSVSKKEAMRIKLQADHGTR